MRQRKLGSHTPPCHRRMVITTLFSVCSGQDGGGGVTSYVSSNLHPSPQLYMASQHGSGC